jgi:hypothetical protein
MEEVSLDLNLDAMPEFDLGTPDTNVTVNKTESKTINLNSNSNISSSSPSQNSTSNIGLDLLVNKNKTSGESSSLKSNVVNEVIKKDEPIKLDDITPKSDSLDDILRDVNLSSEPANEPFEFNTEDALPKASLNSNDDSFFKNLDNSDIFSDSKEKKESIFTHEQTKTRSFEDIQKEKFELLCKLERLEEKGIKISKKFSMASDFDEMQYEFDRAVKDRELNQSVKFQRKMLIAFVTAIEFMNTRFDPFDVKLEGWSESIHENQHDYDDVFEELHEKYKEKAKMAPELKLMMMLGGSAFMFHLTNTMFKSSLPGMGDIMKQNPELMQQFAKAAANTMSQNEESSGFGNLMGDMFGGGGGNSNMGQRQPPQQSQREMRGPPNLDNILNNMSDNNMSNLNMDSGSEISNSDVEEIRNIKLNGRNNRKNGITLDIN